MSLREIILQSPLFGCSITSRKLSIAHHLEMAAKRKMLVATEDNFCPMGIFASDMNK